MSCENIYRWRCAKCNNHFANIENMLGQLVIEKKCTKCKSSNRLILQNSDIRIHCKVYRRDDVEEKLCSTFKLINS